MEGLILNLLGDSHVNTYSLCENTRSYLIGDDLSINNLKKYTKQVLKTVDSRKHEPWLFIIGERDCRKHIFMESIETKEALDDVIEEYVNKLVRFLSVLNTTYVVYAASVSPTGDCGDRDCDYFAPREIRQIITAKYNARLQVISRQKDIPYLCIWKIGAAPKDVYPLDLFEEDKYHIKAEIASKKLDEALKFL